MAINFPTSPSVNDVFTSSNRQWKWDGESWQSIRAGEGGLPSQSGQAGEFLQTDGTTLSWEAVVTDPTMGGDLTGTASNAHLAANSVDSDQYVDGSIDDVHLAIAKLSLSGGTMTGATVFGDQLSSRFTAKDYAETVYAGGNSSTAVTLDETNGNVQTFTMTGNCTFTMPSGSGLQAGTSMTLILTQDGTGSRTGAFTSVKWAGGTAPTLTTTATTGIDILTFYTFNGGAAPTWYGFLSGADMS